MSQDNLKDLFNEAFAAESIPFDGAAWQEMNKLLIAQRRRKLLFGWLSGSMLALIALLGVYFFLPSADASYIPRENLYSSENFQTEGSTPYLASSETSQIVKLAESDHALEEQSSESKPSSINSLSTTAEGLKQASNKTEETITSKDDISKSSAASVDKTNTTSTVFVNSTESENVVVLESAQPTPVIAALEAEQAIPAPTALEETPSFNQLKLMPLVKLENDAEPIAFEDRTIPDVENKRSLNTYLNIGFSKSFDRPVSRGFSRWGQRGGIGATYQLQNNLLLAAEVSIARDMVNYEEVSNRIVYGYEKYEFEQTIRIKEMLLTEVPILIYYRQNRFMVGTGMKLGYLLSTRIEEENSQSVTIEDVGFANWKDLNSMRLSIPVDVNYQLNPTYFVGCRYHYGLNDVFDRTAFTDRNNRLDVYLKMNLTR